MRRRTYSRLLAGAMAVMLTAGSVCTPQVVWAEKTIATETKTENVKRVTVHDPSIVKDQATGTYYVFGSHMATAKSDDLVNWTQIAKDYGMSGIEMNKLLHTLNVQYKQCGQWLLYKKYHDKGYVHSEIFIFKHSNGTEDIQMITKWTQKGRLFLYNLLKQEEILPLIEQEIKQIN